MKRIRRCAAGWVFWGWVLLGGGGAWGQAGGRAVVYPVPTTGEASRFQVPQVRLADAAVARRINRALLRGLLGGWAAVDTNASPRRQLYQAARECCYDADTRTWAAAGGGLTGSEYQVLLNRGGLLSLSLTSQTTGAHHEYAAAYFTFDLRTGRRLTLADAVADPLAQLDRRMDGAINRRFGEAMATAKAAQADSATLDYMAERFDWDWQTNRVRVAATPYLPAPVSRQLPREFALTPTALLLFHSAEFHRLRSDFEPDNTYRFPYARLHPRPLLRALLPAAVPAKAGTLAKKPAAAK